MLDTAPRIGHERAVQVVGRNCELCHERVKQERGAFGCEDCDLVVHHECATASPRASYREPANEQRPTGRSRKVPCPRCGADLRAAKRARDRERDRLHDEAEAARMFRESTKSGGMLEGRRSFIVALIGASIAIRLVLAYLGASD